MLRPVEFEFAFNNELKRAVRSQNFLTLVVVEPVCEGCDRNGTAREVARVISREMRATDLIGATPEGRLSMVLLDADLQNALRVVERLTALLGHYQFGCPLTFDVGLACCPAQGSDAATLRSAAVRTSAMVRSRS